MAVLSDSSECGCFTMVIFDMMWKWTSVLLLGFSSKAWYIHKSIKSMYHYRYIWSKWILPYIYIDHKSIYFIVNWKWKKNSMKIWSSAMHVKLNNTALSSHVYKISCILQLLKEKEVLKKFILPLSWEYSTIKLYIGVESLFFYTNFFIVIHF